MYFNNVIVLQPKKGVADEKNKNHWNCSYVDKKMMCWQWHRMDHFIPAQLTCCPQLYYTFPLLEDFSYGQWVWEASSNEQHLLSNSWCSAWEHKLKLKHFIGQPMGAGFTNINTGSHTKQCTMEYKHMYIHSVIRTSGVCICEIVIWPFCYYHNYHNYGESLYELL